MPELFDEFPVTILPSLPKPQFPPPALGYVDGLHACIGATDTITFADYNWPFYGRIIETSFDKEAVINDPTCVCHSRISRVPACRPNLFFKVQVYAVTLSNNSSGLQQIKGSWPSINSSMPDTIPGAAPTNCIVWIHACQVHDPAFFPHAYDCINQTYGNLSGRDDMFHVDHCLFVSKSGDGFALQFESIAHSGDDSYHIFGYPRPNLITGYTSYTERIFESVCQITRLADTMLTKTGLINSQVTKKIPFPFEAYRFIHGKLDQRHQENLQWSHHSSYSVKTKITTDNLTLSIAKVKSTKWTITANSIEGFDSLRRVVGRIGFGVKKRHPTLAALTANDGSNRLTVQEQDLIHIVDLNDNNILYRGGMSDDEAIHVGQFPERQHDNFIRLSYDTVTRQLILTMKCFSTLVSLLSPESRTYLYSNNVDISSVYALINNRVWKVVQMNKHTNVTMLLNPDDETETIWIDSSIVQENLIDE